MPEEKIPTYSTKVEPQQTLQVDFKGSGFEDVINEAGVIPTTLNAPVIIQRIAKDLYKNATSGIRELYMNAVRGCADGVELFGYKNPHVTVTINEGERIIIIEDNGRGITKARFKQVLRELGTSDNFDGGTTGQFGMGFASYMTLASVCVLDTIGDNGDNYKMLCRDGTSSTYGGESDLSEHGVKLTLTCYPKVQFEEICEMLYETARYASVPTTVVIEEFEYDPPHFSDGINEVEQVTFDDNIPEDMNTIKIETDDFILLASDDNIHSEQRTYLLNVPIESEIELPFYYWTLNIKDERKFQPMPDRDRMREESDESIQKLIIQELKAYCSDIKIEKYSDYIDSPRRSEYLWLMKNPDFAPAGLQATLTQLMKCSGIRHITYTDKSPPAHSLLYWLSEAGESGIAYQGFKNKEYSDKVKPLIRKDCILIITRKAQHDDWKETVEALEAWGVPTVKQILRDNKVKISKKTKGETSDKIIIGHEHSNYYDTTEYGLDDIDETFIRVDSLSMVKMISFVRQFPTNLTFMRNDPALKDTECQVFSKWIQEFKTVEVPTNKGIKTADELARGVKVHYCNDLTPELFPVVENKEETIITDNKFVLGVVLLKYLEHNPTKTEWLSNISESHYLYTMFKEKYGIHMHNDEAKKYFCQHLDDIKPDFQELFARVIVKIHQDYAESVVVTQLAKYLAIIKEYGELESADELAKLRFFYDKWNHLPNKEAGITQIFESLVTQSQEFVTSHPFLLNLFVREDVLPKLYQSVEVRRCVVVDSESTYGDDIAKVSFTTNLRTLQVKDDLKVLGMKIAVSNLMIKIYKNHSLIDADVVVST